MPFINQRIVVVAFYCRTVMAVSRISFLLSFNFFIQLGKSKRNAMKQSLFCNATLFYSIFLSIVINQCTGLSSLWTWQLGQKPWTCDTRYSHLNPSSLHPEVPRVHQSSCTRTDLHCLHGNHQVESQGRQRIASFLLYRNRLKGKGMHCEHYENKLKHYGQCFKFLSHRGSWPQRTYNERLK